MGPVTITVRHQFSRASAEALVNFCQEDIGIIVAGAEYDVDEDQIAGSQPCRIRSRRDDPADGRSPNDQRHGERLRARTEINIPEIVEHACAEDADDGAADRRFWSWDNLYSGLAGG